MMDRDLATLLRLRLRQAQEADVTTRFGRASLTARFTSLLAEVEELPAAKHSAAPLLFASLQELKQRWQRDDLLDPEQQAQSLQWRLEAVLQGFIRRAA